MYIEDEKEVEEDMGDEEDNENEEEDEEIPWGSGGCS